MFEASLKLYVSATVKQRFEQPSTWVVKSNSKLFELDTPNSMATEMPAMWFPQTTNMSYVFVVEPAGRPLPRGPLLPPQCVKGEGGEANEVKGLVGAVVVEN